MSQTLLEKLQLTDERNLLIQGLPSSIEKQFIKLAFAKNLTPLLKSKKIDFALVFAINEVQLGMIVREVLPALHAEGKFWVAYPKPGSKIATTLSRERAWACITGSGYEMVCDVPLDHCWTAVRFARCTPLSSLRVPLRGEAVLEEAGTAEVVRTANRSAKSMEKPVATSRRAGAARRPV
jgi:hypothetical protein